MAVNLNLLAACNYVQAVPITDMDGLWFALVSKMSRLGVAENKRAAKSAGQTASPTGNMRGLFRWIHSLDESATDEDKAHLQCLHAVVRNRFSAAGYAPKSPETSEE